MALEPPVPAATPDTAQSWILGSAPGLSGREGLQRRSPPHLRSPSPLPALLRQPEGLSCCLHGSRAGG